MRLHTMTVTAFGPFARTTQLHIRKERNGSTVHSVPADA